MTRIGSYDYAGLITSYLKQDQPKAVTAGNRMSFSGIDLYSYSSLLARLDQANSVLLVDRSIAGYSVTSRRQANLLLVKAMASNFEVFQISLISSAETNLRSYWNQIDDSLLSYSRARSSRSRASHSADAKRLLEVAKQYAIYTNLDASANLAHYTAKLFELKLL